MALFAAGLGSVALREDEGPASDADVTLRIEDRDGAALLESPVHVASPSNTVLGTLESASREFSFPMETQEFPGLGPMVVSIFDLHAGGACGWVYTVDGRSGDRSAAHYRVFDGQTIRWFWSCHGS